MCVEPSLEVYTTVCVGVKLLEVVLSLSVLIDVEIVTSTSLVIKMELVRVTEAPATTEEDMSTELLVTEIKLYRKTVEHTKHVLHTI